LLNKHPNIVCFIRLNRLKDKIKGEIFDTLYPYT